MYAGVYGVLFGDGGRGYAISVCLEERAAAATAAAGVLLRLTLHVAMLLVRLLRLHDHLPEAVALLVGAAVLHLRHRLLHVSEPRIRHFVLTAGNESGLARARTEVPLTTIRMHII